MTREQMREACPVSAAFVDSMREVFGPEHVKVLYVREGEVERGKPADKAEDRNG